MAMNELAKQTLATSVVHQEGHNCGSCSELITIGVPGYLVQVVRVYSVNNVLQFVPPTDEHGAPEYTAYFFHTSCWEEVVDSLNEVNEDTPPALVEEASAAGECVGCSSHILPGELCVMAAEGSAHLSDLVPNGNWALDWDMTDMHLLCSVCLNEINMNILVGLWGDKHIKQANECNRGVATRCWRYGPCNPEHCHVTEE